VVTWLANSIPMFLSFVSIPLLPALFYTNEINFMLGSYDHSFADCSGYDYMGITVVLCLVSISPTSKMIRTRCVNVKSYILFCFLY